MPELETHRRVIDPADCDILGHMNVSRYFGAASDGGFALQASFGLDREDLIAGRRLSFVVVRSQSAYHSELLAGDVVYQLSGVIEIGSKSALFKHSLYRASDNKLSFETEFRTVLMNLQTRRAVRIPDDVKEAMGAYKITPAA